MANCPNQRRAIICTNDDVLPEHLRNTWMFWMKYEYVKKILDIDTIEDCFEEHDFWSNINQ